MKYLKNGTTKSCGCLRRECVIKHNKDMALDLTGYQKEDITVLYQVGDSSSGSGNIWRCRCKCGNEFNLPVGEIRRNLYGKKDRIGNTCCPKCNAESKGEKKILDILKENNILYEREKIFKGCVNPKTKYTLRYDFYLPKYNCCIEYDGEQHFRPVDYFGGEESFEERQFRDNIKNKYCKDNNISLIRIPYTEYSNLCYNYIIKLIEKNDWSD